MLALSGRSDRRMSEALHRQVPSDATPDPAGLLGLVLEFSVRTRSGGRVHFGSLIHHLGLDGSALDPGDPNAYRCSWGGVITSDGAEAEIATPPVWTRPGFTGELQAWAESGKAALRRAVPHGIELDGYSAHFSAAMPTRLNDPVCRLYAETFAAGLMLLMDRANSPGLLVRPRPGRTELCGEFVEGEALPAVAAFVAGTARACAAAVRTRSAGISLPPRLDVRLAPAVHRYGWYVDRHAFGIDLHGGSRRALLPRASGGTISAQSHLELAWAAARQALADDAASSDLYAAEAMVTGSLPLPTEQWPDSLPRNESSPVIRFPAAGSAVAKTLVSCLCAYVRPGFILSPVAMTWDFTIFEASGLVRTAYVCVPRNSLLGFVDELRAGALDDVIAAYLARSSQRRVLSAHQQTRSVGLYDQLGSPADLLAPERDPQTGRQESRQRAKHAFTRPGKRNRPEHENRESPRRAPEFIAISVPWFARKAVAIGAQAIKAGRNQIRRERRASRAEPATAPNVTQSSPSSPLPPTFPELDEDVQSPRNGDRVECSVFAPPIVTPGSTFLVQAFAHIPSQTRDVMRTAKEFDADATRRANRTLESIVLRGTKLVFRLTMPGFRVDDPVQSMVWLGRAESMQFGVSIPRRYRLGNVVGTITVSQGWIPIGHIKFVLMVASSSMVGQQGPQSNLAVGEAARLYKKAFVSYASENRTRVLEAVQVLPTFGVQTFQDVLDLAPGERWERSLYQHIDDSDIVLLFWSNAAKRSKWVRKEIKYALSLKKGDELAPPEIGPVIIEGPPVPRPWKELSHLHFNDRLIYYMNQ